MLIVRTIAQRDLDGLMSLARLVGDGMTTLKADAGLLQHRIEVACASFAEAIAPEERDYVFVMEDTATRQLVGVCAIKSAVGMQEPFYNYRIGTLVHSSTELGIFSRMETLYLSNDLTGSAELCSLFLHPEYRTGSNGKLLSKCRFLFMAQFPHLFGDKLIAEMRGFQRPDGTSPFWENLGRHFFQMDFKRADDLSSLGKKSFIAELMPRHPLYVAYLPAEARDVIGMVHVDTAPARHLLEQEGLFYDGYIDIFDAGPVLQARVTDLRSLRESVLIPARRVPDAGYASGTPSGNPQTVMVATTEMGDFRVTIAQFDLGARHVDLTDEMLGHLHCASGELLRSLLLSPKKNRVS